MIPNILLSPEEIQAITGYQQQAKQLQALLARGYWRAHRSPRTGSIILEREHYLAVSRGETLAAGQQQQRPRVRPVLRIA